MGRARLPACAHLGAGATWALGEDQLDLSCCPSMLSKMAAISTQGLWHGNHADPGRRLCREGLAARLRCPERQQHASRVYSLGTRVYSLGTAGHVAWLGLDQRQDYRLGQGLVTCFTMPSEME